MRLFTMQTILIAVALQACDLQGTEVGNGAKPPGKDITRDADPNMNEQTPFPGVEMPNSIGINDKVQAILSSSCHSLLISSRAGISVTPYTVSGDLPVAVHHALDETRPLRVSAGSLSPVSLGSQQLVRQSPGASGVTCAGEETLTTEPDTPGLLILASAVNLDGIEYSVTIVRQQSGGASRLKRVEIRGPDGMRVEWGQ